MQGMRNRIFSITPEQYETNSLKKRTKVYILRKGKVNVEARLSLYRPGLGFRAPEGRGSQRL